jgi:thiol-disulfide isomerase/thioredoxin
VSVSLYFVQREYKRKSVEDEVLRNDRGGLNGVLFAPRDEGGVYDSARNDGGCRRGRRFAPKKISLITVAALVMMGCAGSKTSHDPNEKMERGWIDRSALMKPDYPRFKENFDTLHVDNNFVEMIKTLHSGIDVLVALGTWCSDSKREVPRFLKIADLASIASAQIKYYGVDRTKKSADGLTDRYRIERVPTFIFLKQGNEVGRIVESPKNSLEEDMLVILADAQGK